MMAFDAGDGYLVIFGGWNGTYLNDTWAFSGGAWVSLATQVAPPARAGGMLAYDAADGELILFGGYDGHYLADTWAFAHDAWRPLAETYAPSARANGSMAFDDAEGLVMLFGGSSAAGALGDTWAFRAGHWARPILHSLPPQARAGAALDFDPSTGSVVLFGGEGSSFLADTWQYHAGTWTAVSSSNAPSGRAFAAMTFDPADSVDLLFGGTNGTALRETWAFHNGNWTRWPGVNAPAVRWAPAVSFDAADGYVVLFGGTATAPYGDTWGFRASTTNLSWSALPSGVTPLGRTQAGLVYDSSDGYALLFGGHAGSGSSILYGDTWSYRGGVWTELHPPLAPTPRRAPLMVYDSADGYVLLFGGSSSRGYLNDTWSFHAGVWKHVHPPRAPPARRSMGGAYDAADGYVLLFGGHSGIGRVYHDFNDTWTFRAGHWTELAVLDPPAARAEPMMTFDPAIGAVVMFDGYADGASHIRLFDDTWTFAHGNWTLLCRPCVPPQRDGGAVSFDPMIGAVVVYGGHNNSTVFGDSWALAGGGWVELCAVCAAQVRDSPSMTFDPSDGYLLLFGGGYPRYLDRAAPWAFAPPLLASVRATPTPADVGVPIDLNASYSGPWTQYSADWNFGDGNSSGSLVASHTYASPGRFNTSFSVTAASGIQSTVVLAVLVTARPSLNLSEAVGSIDAGQEINLSATVSGGAGPVTVSWNFGNGSSATGTTVDPRFPTAGSFGIAAWANDSEVSTVARLTVLVYPDTAVQLAVLRPSTDLGHADRFSVLPVGGAPPYRVTWHFGDGASANGTSVGHAYASPGIFNVSAWVNDSSGWSCLRNATVTVHGLPLVFANESGNLTDVGVPLDFAVSGAGGTGPYSYNWSFSSGTGSNLSEFAARFALPGSYNATVELTDAVGASAWSNLTFRVVPLPSVNVTVGRTATDEGVPLNVSVTVRGGVGPIHIGWTFGDGATAVGTTVAHNYTAAGVFVIQATAQDADGLNATAQLSVTISARPGLSLTASEVANGSNGTSNNISFEANVTGGTGPFNVSWQFGDGAVAFGRSPIHDYGAWGNFTVNATVVDADGISSTSSINLTLNATGVSAHPGPPAPGAASGPSPCSIPGLAGSRRAERARPH